MKRLALLVLLALLPCTAFADTLQVYPGASLAAVWDITTGNLYSLGVNGVATAQTIIPNAATATTWSATNNFTGTFKISGVVQMFPTSGIIVGTTDSQTLTNKTLTTPVVTTLTVPTGGVAIGTTAAASGTPLTLVGLATTSPGSGGGYVCADSVGQTYTKSTCP